MLARQMSPTLATLSRNNFHVGTASRNLRSLAPTMSRRNSAKLLSNSPIRRTRSQRIEPVHERFRLPSLDFPRHGGSMVAERRSRQLPCDASPSLPRYPQWLHRTLTNEDSPLNLEASAISRRTHQPTRKAAYPRIIIPRPALERRPVLATSPAPSRTIPIPEQRAIARHRLVCRRTARNRIPHGSDASATTFRCRHRGARREMRKEAEPEPHERERDQNASNPWPASRRNPPSTGDAHCRSESSAVRRCHIGEYPPTPISKRSRKLESRRYG